MLVEPRLLEDVISASPAMRPKRRSSGVATADAMVSGLAPGSDALTWIVGKSTCGKGATGKWKYASSPASKSAAASRLVATGRWMNGAEMFMASGSSERRARALAAGKAAAEAVHVQVNHGRRVEREHLRNQEPAHDADAERPPELRAHARTERERQRAEQRRHGRHHDRSEAEQARLVNRLERRDALVALRFERKIDHHDRVLLHDADQEHDPDQRDHVEVALAHDEREQRADARRRQRAQNRDRVDVALVKHAEHDVDRDESREDEHRFARERLLERLRRAGVVRAHAARLTDALLHRVDGFHGVAERLPGRDVERDRYRGKLALVIDGERRGRGRLSDHGTERNRLAGNRAHEELVEYRGAVGDLGLD